MTARRPRWLCLVALALLAGSAPVAAQTKTTFIHGLKSNGGTWQTTADRLTGELLIDPRRPTTDWTAPFDDQALTLQTNGDLSGSTIAIGHSNGGVVARRWSQMRHLDAIVTVGTPHYGAPFVTNIPLYVGYFTSVENAISNAAGLVNWLALYRQDDPYFSCCDWWWVATQVLDSLSFGASFMQYGVYGALASLGLDVYTPVLGQMNPLSGFIQDLNSGGNIGAEVANVPTRIGVISSASLLGGPMRLAFDGGTADWVGATFHAIAYGLYYVAYDLAGSLDYYDDDGWDLVYRLEDIAQALDAWDAVWCSAVSSVGMYACYENDAIVPAWSQAYPSAINVITPQQSGPAHTQETGDNWVHDRLYEALAYHVGIPPRGGGGGGGSDSTVINGGSTLSPNQTWASPSGEWVLKYQDDGNFVLYRNGAANWAINCWPQCNDTGYAGNSFTPAGYATMQTDGNLVVYNGYGAPVWHVSTYGNPGAYLAVRNDGAVIVYGPGGNILWQR